MTSTAAASVEEIHAEFERANRLYDQGKYAEAAAVYDSLIEDGHVSPALWFNRGNACFKLSRIGEAILSYRMAERLTPRDSDLHANLNFARAQVAGIKSARAEHWRQWLRKLTLDEWTLATSVVFWAGFLILAGMQWRPEWKAGLRRCAWATAIAGGILLIGFAAAVHDLFSTRTAIVVQGEALVHTGPLDESAMAYAARDGAELKVLDERGDWLRVSDGQKRIGWIQREAVLVLEAKATRSRAS